MSIAIGIDLGTTNTVVGAVRDGRAITLSASGGGRLIPSVVSFHPSGKVLVGEPAKERRIVDPTNTVSSVKRLIGRLWGSEEVERSRLTFSFQLVEGPKGGIAVESRGETYTLPEISAFVLRRAKQVAETALEEPVEKAVITVPANFNDLQRAATKLAGKLAGLEVLRILNEPTAAALAYGHAMRGQDAAKHERVAVYDLGGGTFDITLLDLTGSVFEVLATGGDTALGGDDIDHLVAQRMAQQILERHRIDPRGDPAARATMLSRAETLKQGLSTREESSVDLNDVVRGREGVFLPFRFAMTRGELEKLAEPLVARTLETCSRSLKAAGIELSQLDRVILVGGSTRMPLVAQRVEQFFRRPPTTRVNPDEVVALGAAIQASALSRPARPTSSGPPSVPSAGRLPVGSRAAESSPAVGAEALPIVDGKRAPPAPPKVPAAPKASPASKQSRTTSSPFDFTLESPARSLDFELPRPAAPAAPEAAIRPASSAKAAPMEPSASNEPTLSLPSPLPPTPPSTPKEPVMELLAPPLEALRTAPLLIDVTPISLGVEVAGAFTDILIRANTPVPCDRTRVFRTASDGQTSVAVRVAQGESSKFEQNTMLGNVELSGLRAAPRGDVQIAVTFEIDSDGILNVRAKDVDSGREMSARMNLLGAQNDKGAVDAMVARQERHALG